MKALFVALSATAALTSGSGLVQLSGKAGCISSSKLDAGCARGRVVATPHVIAVSPDGRNVYAAGGVGSLSSLVVFARDTSTGALAQLAAPDGCVTVSKEVTGCAHGRALETPSGLALSPDGHNLYVAAPNSGAVAVFARNAKTGALAQLPATDACVSSLDTGGRCASDPGLGHPLGIAVTPDGKNVYAAGDGVAVFARGANGSLHPVQTVPGQRGQGVAVSQDGKNVYLVAGGGSHGSITAYARDSATGSLASLGCIAQKAEGGCASGVALQQPGAVIVSPDGKNVYVASVVSSGVAVFLRTPNGSLAQLPGRGACVTAGGSGGYCEQAPGLVDASSVAVSPDAKNVYTAAFHGSKGGLSTFARDPLTGRLTPAGCLAATKVSGCRPARNLLAPTGIALAPDGRSVYAASMGSRPPGQLARGGGVTIFRRS